MFFAVSQLLNVIIIVTFCQQLFSFFSDSAEKEGFEPSRRVNDLLPFQGSPFGQLGYFSITALLQITGIFNNTSK